MLFRNRFLVLCTALLLSCLLWGCSAPEAETAPATVPVTTATPEYTVTFQLNGGRLVAGETVQTVAKGQAAQAPEVRWGIRELTWDRDFSSITADTTVNAVWIRKELSDDALRELSRKVTVRLAANPVNGPAKTGSGFFVDSDGTFATAFHLIEQAADITVTTQDGTIHPLEQIVAFSPALDVALLKIDLETPDYLDICAETAADMEPAFITGFQEQDFTAAAVTEGDYPLGKSRCIQLDAAIPAEAVGGPLLNRGGEALGISCYQEIRGEKINLAVSAAALQELEAVNLTLEEMQQWYDAETALSYRPGSSDRRFFDSLVHTYTNVTGRNCFASMTLEGALKDGYVEDCVAYMHSYKPEEMERYATYLLSLGFVLLDTINLAGGQVQTTYINDVTNITITCLLDADTSYLTVIPAVI